ncbi:MAG: non-canonical purine NTP pyrophosphatase [Candidatus Saccharibacteria bacterium]|nr:non-canonical purine NTP pyrophosphatase [Candidatus Saccharibacteria bacterium]
MKELVFATGNTDKFNAAKTVLNSHGFKLIQKPVEVDEIQGEDELIITRDKAEKIYRKLQHPVLVNDDSWAITALNGFPGAYMKSVIHWFKPEDFIRLMQGVKDRGVILTQVTVYQDKEVQKIFTKQIPGTILLKPTDYPGPSWANICTLTKDKRSMAEVRNTTPDQLVKEHDTVWNDVAIWLKQ